MQAFALSDFGQYSTLERTMKQRLYARLAALSATALATTATFAQAADPITAALDSVDLTGIAVKVAAVGLLVVGIALAFKGPDVAKRVVRKV